MANKNTSVEVLGTESTTEVSSMQLSTDNLKLNELKNYFEQFSAQDTNVMRSLTADYLEIVENTTYNLICNGMTTFLTSDGEEREAVILIDKENKTYINGGAVLVSSCKKLKEYPAFIRIITGAKVKSEKGKYLSMEVRTI
jgi:hypothetical protein